MSAKLKKTSESDQGVAATATIGKAKTTSAYLGVGLKPAAAPTRIPPSSTLLTKSVKKAAVGQPESEAVEPQGEADEEPATKRPSVVSITSLNDTGRVAKKAGVVKPAKSASMNVKGMPAPAASAPTTAPFVTHYKSGKMVNTPTVVENNETDEESATEPEVGEPAEEDEPAVPAARKGKPVATKAKKPVKKPVKKPIRKPVPAPVVEPEEDPVENEETEPTENTGDVMEPVEEEEEEEENVSVPTPQPTSKPTGSRRRNVENNAENADDNVDTVSTPAPAPRRRIVPAVAPATTVSPQVSKANAGFPASALAGMLTNTAESTEIGFSEAVQWNVPTLELVGSNKFKVVGESYTSFFIQAAYPWKLLLTWTDEYKKIHKEELMLCEEPSAINVDEEDQELYPDGVKQRYFSSGLLYTFPGQTLIFQASESAGNVRTIRNRWGLLTAQPIQFEYLKRQQRTAAAGIVQPIQQIQQPVGAQPVQRVATRVQPVPQPQPQQQPQMAGTQPIGTGGQPIQVPQRHRMMIDRNQTVAPGRVARPQHDVVQKEYEQPIDYEQEPPRVHQQSVVQQPTVQQPPIQQPVRNTPFVRGQPQSQPQPNQPNQQPNNNHLFGHERPPTVNHLDEKYPVHTTQPAQAQPSQQQGAGNGVQRQSPQPTPHPGVNTSFNKPINNAQARFQQQQVQNQPNQSGQASQAGQQKSYEHRFPPQPQTPQQAAFNNGLAAMNNQNNQTIVPHQNTQPHQNQAQNKPAQPRVQTSGGRGGRVATRAPVKGNNRQRDSDDD